MAAMNAVGRMCPPPRSLALEANARFMVRVQVDPAEYKVAARDLRPWRAPLGSLSIDPESRSRPGQGWRRSRGRQHRCAPPCGGLRPVLTAAPRGARWRADREVGVDGPAASRAKVR